MIIGGFTYATQPNGELQKLVQHADYLAAVREVATLGLQDITLVWMMSLKLTVIQDPRTF